MKFLFLNGISDPHLQQKFMKVKILLTKIPTDDQKNEPEFIRTKLLPEVFSAISVLDRSEFDLFVEKLLHYALFEWENEKCFVSIKLVGLIFGYISRIAPKEVVLEFLVLFSKDESPPQVKFFILPEVAKYSKHPLKQVLTDNFLVKDFNVFDSIKTDSTAQVLDDLEKLSSRMQNLDPVPQLSSTEKQRLQNAVNALNSQYKRICPT